MTTIDLTVGTSQPSSFQHPSSIVHIVYGGGPLVVFIAIYVGWPSSEQGPCDRGPSLKAGFLPVMENLENGPTSWKTWKTLGI